ncbi:MAG: electron transport complex subunit RsxC, partial [Clostridia bacterium]|nr:electron transport complex subunit RsxC [Clostridia bacterium]
MPYFKLGTVHVPHLKNTALKAAVKMPPPETVRISMSQHIGAPAAPSVKPGDTVYVGTVVGTATGYVSSAVHSSVSGKVKKLDEILTSQGKKVPCVVIESDGLMTPDPAVKPPVIDTLD